MTPEPWEFVLLALGTYRLWRIAARDSITGKVREAVTGYDDAHAPPLENAHQPTTEPRLIVAPQITVTVKGPPRAGRRYLSALIRCPWCLGWWLSLLVAGAWWLWPTVTVAAAFPLALSACLGLVRKNLDE